MDIEIGYFPKHYFSEEPDAGGSFPFAIEGAASYVFDVSNFYLPECDENFLLFWMENIKAFPIYFCAEFSSFWKEVYETACKEANVSYKYLFQRHRLSIAVTEVQNREQFQKLLPIFISMGSSNEIVLWSKNKDVFSVEQRKWKGNWEGKVTETIIVKINANTSIFWIGYDGDNIAVLSNNLEFSTYKNICRTLPDFINPAQCEYG